MQSSKAWFFRLFANGKTFAPSASEVKAHDLRGLNYYPLLKVFCELFFKKSENLYLTNYSINQNLKRTRKARPYDKLGLTPKNPSKQKRGLLTSPQHFQYITKKSTCKAPILLFEKSSPHCTKNNIKIQTLCQLFFLKKRDIIKSQRKDGTNR